MSSEVAIRVENLAKRYRYGGTAPLSQNLRADITDWLRGMLRRNSDHHPTLHEVHEKHLDESPEYFWALKDVNLEIKQGEVVGIIGRNGAGKSTLLKILSRITPPTAGKMTYRGRMASLLEVGTGFHRELTGRENIFLNGSILGMKRSEIASKLDEIIAFAEVEKFIDTPVKFYSSGMYVRLAFAVAAHLEPEILLVDEVLAVGDAAFQKKCLGKMGDVAKQGRAVLFVSHNMGAIEALCSTGLVLDKGSVVAEGPTDSAVSKYLELMSSVSRSETLEKRTDRQGDGSVRVKSISVEDLSGGAIHCTSRLKVTIDYKSEVPLSRPTFLVGIYDIRNIGLYLLNSDAVGGLPEVLPPSGRVVCVTEPMNLTPGACHVNVAVQKGPLMADYIPSATQFDVETEALFSGKVPPRSWVLCLLPHKWQLEKDNSNATTAH